MRLLKSRGIFQPVYDGLSDTNNAKEQLRSPGYNGWFITLTPNLEYCQELSDALSLSSIRCIEIFQRKMIAGYVSDKIDVTAFPRLEVLILSGADVMRTLRHLRGDAAMVDNQSPGGRYLSTRIAQLLAYNFESRGIDRQRSTRLAWRELRNPTRQLTDHVNTCEGLFRELFGIGPDFRRVVSFLKLYMRHFLRLERSTCISLQTADLVLLVQHHYALRGKPIEVLIPSPGAPRCHTQAYH